MDYSYHVWRGTSRSSHSSLNRAFMSLRMMNNFPPYNLFLPDKTLKYLTSLSQFPKKVFWRTASLNFTSSIFHGGKSGQFRTHFSGPPSSLSYFIGEMEGPFEQLLLANRFFQNFRELTYKTMLPWSLQSSSKFVLTNIFPTYQQKLDLLINQSTSSGSLAMYTVKSIVKNTF